MKSRERIIFVVGPTAVGKSAVAYALAQRLLGEIISVDSMQIYQDISIASNKPTDEEQQSIPHHLLSIVSVEDEFDVAQFNQLAMASIADIHARGKIPIIAGGSGMYVQVLLDGIFQSAPRDDKIRASLEHQVETYGSEHLYAILQEKDLAAANKIHPNDSRRIIRALEVCMLEGKPISELRQERQGIWGKYDIDIYGLTIEREWLYERINKRVDEMFAQGIVAEISDIKQKKLSPTFKGLIGISEVLGFLNQEYDIERAKYLMKLNTRHYAKRQLTWFRREERINWVMIQKNDTIDTIVDRCLNKDFYKELI